MMCCVSFCLINASLAFAYTTTEISESFARISQEVELPGACNLLKESPSRSLGLQQSVKSISLCIREHLSIEHIPPLKGSPLWSCRNFSGLRTLKTVSIKKEKKIHFFFLLKSALNSYFRFLTYFLK